MKKTIIIISLLLLIIIIGFIVWKWKGNDKQEAEESVNTAQEVVPEDNLTSTSTETGTEGQTEEQQINLFIKMPIIDDIDGDGLSDEQEKAHGTSQNSSDTDGDGLSDLKEIEKTGTNPLKSDSDGDGYWDGVEIMNGYNPLG